MPSFINRLPTNKKILLFSMAAIAVSTRIGYCLPNSKQSNTASLWDALDHYGFKRLEQKQALELLMKKAGILKKTDSFRSAFPDRGNNSTLLLKDILEFVSIAQTHFIRRTGIQERWTVSPSQWMTTDQEEILEALRKLNLVEEITPTFSNPDVLCILGAKKNSMASRMEHAAKLVNRRALKPHCLVLLAGERRVTIGVDGSEEFLSSIAKKYGINSLEQVTETHLMREFYLQSSQSSQSTHFNTLPMHMINTPAGSLPRPTTATTIQAFCEWMKAFPTIKRITFISNQPHVKYQEAVINDVFKREGLLVEFEVIGPKVEQNLPIQNLVGELGSQIWAQTPSVIAKLKLKAPDQDVADLFTGLYANHPLIFHNPADLFSQRDDHGQLSANKAIK